MARNKGGFWTDLARALWQEYKDPPTPVPSVNGGPGVPPAHFQRLVASGRLRPAVEYARQRQASIRSAVVGGDVGRVHALILRHEDLCLDNEVAILGSLAGPPSGVTPAAQLAELDRQLDAQLLDVLQQHYGVTAGVR